MRITSLINGLMGGVIVACTAAVLFIDRPVVAADHNEPGSRVGRPTSVPMLDRGADIADIYVWQTETKFVMCFTFGGPYVPEAPGLFDRDVVYQIRISDDSNISTIEKIIEFRFAPNAAGQWGVQAKGLPGLGSETVVVPLQKEFAKNGTRFIAGLYEDPFFFDVLGLDNTRTNGDLRFVNTRDFFANGNISGFAIETDKANVLNGNNILGFSVATNRIKPGL